MKTEKTKSSNEEIQKIAQEISPLLSEFGNDITLNEALFKRVKAVYDQKDNLELTVEQNTLLDKKYKSFSRNGANLSEDKKKRLREIDAKLAKLKLTFGENVLAETNKYQLHLTDESDLDGLPEGAKEAAAQLATSKGKEDGWLITLDYPSYIPFMKYAKNRALRKELSLAFGSKGFHNDELDNQENVLEIAKLRFERANLLGYKTHADFVLEERMAETPEKVHSFLNELLEKAKPAAEREFKQLEDFAKKLDGIDRLEKWDSSYYSEKLKQELFNLDDEKLKPYFKLENVINGVFKVAENLFDLGKQIFLGDGNCASCHILQDANSNGNIGPNLNVIKPDISRVLMAVKNGIGVMPAYQWQLSDEEIEAVATYVVESTN